MLKWKGKNKMSKQSELYIHIGTHKTGTTAIRKAIRSHKKKLGREGIRDIGRPLHFKKIRLSESINEEIADFSKKELAMQIKRESLFGRNKLIISAEHFCGNVCTGYDNSQVVAEYLKAITDELPVRVRIIVYLRRQDNFVQSMYTQLIKEGASFEFEEYLDDLQKDAFNWERLVNGYAKQFGSENIILKKYDKEEMQGLHSLVQGFGEIIGSKFLSKNRDSSSSNNGLSPDAVDLLKKINPYLSEFEQGRLRRILENIRPKKPFAAYNYFSFTQRNEFLERYTKSNAEIAKRYFNTDRLFAVPERDHDKIEYDGLTEKDVIRLFAEILGKQSKSQGNKKHVSIRNSAFKKIRTLTDRFPALERKMKLIAGKYS
jgi:hypothetical protein